MSGEKKTLHFMEQSKTRDKTWLECKLKAEAMLAHGCCYMPRMKKI